MQIQQTDAISLEIEDGEVFNSFDCWAVKRNFFLRSKCMNVINCIPIYTNKVHMQECKHIEHTFNLSGGLNIIKIEQVLECLQ